MLLVTRFIKLKYIQSIKKLDFCSLVSDLMTTAVKGKSCVELNRIFAMEFETSVIYEYFWLHVM